MTKNFQSVDTAEELNLSEGLASHPYYLWTFPGSPVRVYLRLDVVARMREQLKNSISKPEDRAETGGILLGTARPGHIEIDGFEPILCVRNDPYFVVSENEKPKLRAAMDRSAGSKEKSSVVGFYRSSIRTGLSLAGEDLILIEEFFQNPSNVFLVIGPGDGDEPNAGFFFWDSGSVFGDMTFMPFPFHERLLVPCDSISPPEPKLVQNEIPQVSLPIKSSRQPNLAASTAPVSKRWTRAEVAIPVGFVIAILTLGILFLLPKLRPSNPSQVQTPAHVMTLAAALSGNAVVVSWDANSAPVSEAREGMLTIRDGSVRRELPLTKSMLSARNLVFKAVTETLQIQLEVYSPTGKSTRETVLVLLSPRGQEAAGEKKSAPSLETRLPSSSDKRRPNQPSSVIPFMANQTAPAVIRAETATRVMPIEQNVTAAQSQGPTNSATPPLRIESLPILEQPPNLVSRPAIENENPAIVQHLQPPAPAPPPSPSPSPSPSTISLPVQPPKPIRQIRAVLPVNVKALLSQEVQVQVKVSIDETGKVVRAEPLPQKGIGGFLGVTAANAARLWKFEPARRAGQPVASEAVLQFHFGPEKVTW